MGANVHALVGAHGSGLANSVFLAKSSWMVELDAFSNRQHQRFMYQELAAACGLRPRKVWLTVRGRGKSVDDAEVRNCTRFYANGSAILGITDEELSRSRLLPY